MELIKRLIEDEEGQGLAEYTLIVGLIALISVTAIGAAGGSIKNVLDKIKDSLNTAVSSL